MLVVALAMLPGTPPLFVPFFLLGGYALANSGAFAPPLDTPKGKRGRNSVLVFVANFFSKKFRCQSSKTSTCQSSQERSRIPMRCSFSSCRTPLSAKYPRDRKSTRLNSSHTVISYAVFCLKKK